MKKVILFLILSTFISTVVVEAQISSIKTVVSLTGSMLNKENNEPVSVTFEAYNSQGKRVYRGKSNATENGYYFITGLQPGETYTIKFIDMEYLRSEEQYTLPVTDKYTEFSRDFQVVQKQKDQRLLFKVPPFELGKNKIRFGIEDLLDSYVEIIKTNKNVVFEIACYPDANDEKTKNETLTLARAQSLKDFFVQQGAKPESIILKGNPSIDPKNPPPAKKGAKGKRYIGSTYLIIKKV